MLVAGVVVAIAARIPKVGYAWCLTACGRAFGGDAPFASIVVVNWAATTLGNAAPVPGGLGVAEAGLIAGLSASGVTTDVAMGLVGGVAEVSLTLVCAWAAGRRFDLDGLPAGAGRIALVALLVAGVAVAIAARIPKVRAVVRPHLRRMWATVLRLARSPRATLTIAASSLATVILYALCLTACVRAFGGDASLASVVVVNWAATTLGNVAPVPGGLGVAEAGLIAGLSASGVTTDVAVAAALTHRLTTFWLPPIAGWFALRHLRRRDLV